MTEFSHHFTPLSCQSVAGRYRDTKKQVYVNICICWSCVLLMADTEKIRGNLTLLQVDTL